MEAKLQRAFFAVKDCVILPFLHRQAMMHCILWCICGRLGITAEMLTRLACTAFQERGREREFWQGLRTAPDPKVYCSASFMLYRDSISEMLNARVSAVSDPPKPHHESIDVREHPR